MQESGTQDLPLNGFPSLLQTLISNRSGLLKTAARITGCHSRAEDVVQDAFLRVSSMKADALPFNARLNYIFRIVRNLARARVRPPVEPAAAPRYEPQRPSLVQNVVAAAARLRWPSLSLKIPGAYDGQRSLRQRLQA